MKKFIFPFTAIVGQERLKTALLCNAIHPGIGGVLVTGTRGTAKSTAARALADLLPDLAAAQGCPFHCAPDDRDQMCPECLEKKEINTLRLQTPFVNLPLGSTEDRVIGSIDMERAIREGARSFEPGLLANANRGILYIDEVNLLGDHLVDILLDVAAMGVNHVEREGISYIHPARLILIGTMNPEEGELRPQLLDRFGLSVEMENRYEASEREEIVRRRSAFDDAPDVFLKKWEKETQALREDLIKAKKTFRQTFVSDDLISMISQICAERHVDGLRADLTIHKTARAIAALEGRKEVDSKDIDVAASLALAHRGTPMPPQPPKNTPPSPPKKNSEKNPSPPNQSKNSNGEKSQNSGTKKEQERKFHASGGMNIPILPKPFQKILSLTGGLGKRTQMITKDKKGHYFKNCLPGEKLRDIALDATFRAAAPFQKQRRTGRQDKKIILFPSDFREKIRKDRIQHLIMFVVDSSGSMGVYQRMAAVKGAIASLLENAYQKRDMVSLVGFRRKEAQVLLPPTRSALRAARRLMEIPTGGKTPLGAGLKLSLEIISRERQKNPRIFPLIVLVSDGRSNQSVSAAAPLQETEEWAKKIRHLKIPSLCLDTEVGALRFGLMKNLALKMNGKYLYLGDVETDRLASLIQDRFVLPKKVSGI